VVIAAKHHFELRISIDHSQFLGLGLPLSASIAPVRDGLALHDEFHDLAGILTLLAHKISGVAVHLHNPKSFEM
jgi:hypothetical protein